MTRSMLIGLLGASLLLGAAGLVVVVRPRLDSGASQDVAAANDAGIGVGHPVYDFDPTDDRALAAYATDIFVGRVAGQTGTVGAATSAPGQEVPQTQFAVEVLLSLEGEAAGTVTVNQIGGVDRQAGQLMLLAGDALLRPGATELFLTVAVPERDWYQIVAAGYGHRPAHDAVPSEALIARFTQAAAPADGDGS